MMASDQDVTPSDLIDLSTFLEETSENQAASPVDQAATPANGAASPAEDDAASTVQAASPVEPVSELQQALRIVKNADLHTTKVIHEACTGRVEELQDHLANLNLLNTLNEAVHLYPEQASLQAPEAQNQRTTTNDSSPQISKSISTSTIDQIPEEIDETMGQQTSKGHQMSKGRDEKPTGQSGRLNDFPTHMPYAKLYDSGDHSYRFNEPLRPYPPEPRTPSVSGSAFNPGQDTPQSHDPPAEYSTDHMRKASHTAKMSMNCSEQMVADASKGFLTSMKDKVMATAASVASLSTMKNRMPGAFDEEDELLFGPLDRPTKRLELVREESPLETITWKTKEKDRRQSSFMEDGHCAALRKSIAVDGEIAAIRLSRDLSPAKKTPTNDLPTTPLPKALRPASRSAFPPRISSLSSPASEISEKVTDNNGTGISGVDFGSFPDDIDLDYTYGSEESRVSDMRGAGEIGNVDEAAENGFEPIGGSQLMSGFKRISSAHALSDMQGPPRSTRQKSFPQLGSSKNAATGQQKPSGLTRRTTNRARDLTTNLFRKASATIRRTKRNDGPGQQMVKRGDDGSEESKGRGRKIPRDEF